MCSSLVRHDVRLTRVLQAVVTVVVGFLVARGFGMSAGTAAASAVALVLPLELLFAFARWQRPDEAPSSRDAT